MSITIKLSKPLETHKGTVSEIELNEPAARCFVRYGDPFIMRGVGQTATVEWDNKSTMSFLADMSGTDAVLLEALPAVDYNKLRDAMFALIWGVAGDNPTKP